MNTVAQTLPEQFTAEQVHAAVARGAAWLDRRYPDWAKAIDVHTLDLYDGDHCILGQTASVLISEDAEDAIGLTPYAAALNHFAPEAQGKWAARYGFDVPRLRINESERANREYMIYYEMLTLAWLVLIRERLAALA
jgi:hypothetical protein